MGLFNSIWMYFRKRNFPMVGIVDAVCPYCNAELIKKPGRKKKCPQCGNFIFVRTSPKTNEKILVTDSQRDIIEEQWCIVNGTHAEFKQNKKKIDDEKQALKKKFGREPTENDVKWSLLSKQVKADADDGNWDLYRNSKFAMAEVLSAESRVKQALSTYLEVTYLDINGPCNTSGYSSKEFPAFQTTHAMIAPGVITRATKLIKKMDLSEVETKGVFSEIAEINYKNLNLPVKPETAWKEIKKEIF